MSCNNIIPLRTLADRVAAILAANYIDKDDPRITNGVFTSPSIRGEFLLDPEAKGVFCDLVQSCVTSAPFGKTWLTKPLYPGAVLVSYEDNGETKYRWTTEDELVPNKMLIPKPTTESAVAVSHVVGGKTSITWKPIQDVVGEAVNDEMIMLSSIVPETPLRSLKDKTRERISLKDFGAKGDGNQTVETVPTYMSGRDKSFPITQQTADGMAINKAIRYLRSVGGGSLFVPKGEYRVYSYLEHIDFPLVLYGEGANSIIKNCDDSPTDVNSYGLLIIQTKPDEGAQSEVIVRDILFDGNAPNRVKPTKEFQLYPLVVYGWGGVTLENVTSINSPIDCLNIAMDTGYEGKENHVTVRGCKFSNSYRNSVTVGKGENITFSQCLIEKGGFVHGGTNPKACLDMEPNIASSGNAVIWDSCTFKSAVNIVLAGVWTKASFTNCIIDAGELHPNNVNNGRDTFPWMGQLTAGQFDISNCSFIGRKDTMVSSFFHYNGGKAEQLYTHDSYLRIKGCSFDYCGINSSSRSISLTDCQSQMSLVGWVFNGGNANPECDVYIQNCHLKNVFGSSFLSGGLAASCSITSGVKGKVFVDGLNCIVDKNLLSKMPLELLTSNISSARGFGIVPSSSADIINERVIKNVYTAGFYRILPDYMGVPRSAEKFRDWASPSAPPLDSDLRTPNAVLTLKDDTVIKTDVLDEGGAVVSSTYKLKDKTVLSELSYPASNSIVALGAYTKPGTYYKNCTMWGDYS